MLRETTTRFPHVAIRASAGAGKTYRLATRFVGLLLAGEQADRILATTFTRKAAGEIMERVLMRLVEAARNDFALTRLASDVERADLTREHVLDVLVRLVRGLHRVRIRTLDSFFGGLAGAFGFEIGLPPTYTVVEEDRDDALRLAAIDAALRELGTDRTVSLMRLLGKGVAPQRIAEHANKVVKALHGVYLEAPAAAWRPPVVHGRLDAAALVAAIDVVAAVPIADAQIAKARGDDLARAENGDWAAFIAAGLAKKLVAGDGIYFRKPIDDAVVSAYRPLIAHARASLIAALSDQTVASYELLETYHRHYTAAKLGSRSVRFDDITRSLAVRALRGMLDEIYFRLDGRIAHLLLDEFQDTARMQWQVLRPFAEEVVAHSDETRSFFCVGDVKQAIYGWRGGVAEIFEALGSQLPSVKWDQLAHSRRSSPVIIDAVNQVFATIATNAALRKHTAGAAAWATGFQPHTTARPTLPGYVCLLTAGAGDDDAASRRLRALRAAAVEVARIARETPVGSIGVLARTNGAVARLIFELRRLDTPASQEGGSTLTDSAAVTLVLSLLTLADHPGDTAARFHVQRSPLGASLGLDDAKPAPALSLQLRATLLHEGYGATVRTIADRLQPFCSERDRGRLRQLVELAHAWQPSATLRAREFVAHVNKQKLDDPTDARVRVMTVHQAKGLEFDVVVLPELEADLVRTSDARVLVERGPVDGAITRVVRYVTEDMGRAFPELGTMRDAHDEQVTRESLSVLYVAMTRAVHALHMVIAPSAANEKAPPTRYSGVLRTALHGTAAVAPDTVVFERGDAAWGQTRVAAPEVAAREAEAPDAIALAPAPATRTRGLPRRSPSDPESASRVDLAARLLRPQHAAALARGTLVHAWLEQIEWLDGAMPDESRLRAIAALHGFRGPAIDERLAEFREMLGAAALRSALTRPSGARDGLSLEVARELPFAVRDGDALLTGTIDRAVFTRVHGVLERAEVFEFKTDRARGGIAGESDERGAVHRAQTDAYRRAVRRMTGLAPAKIRVRLVLLSAGTIVDA